MTTLKNLAAVVAATLTITACGPALAGSNGVDRPARPEAALVTVENQNWSDMVVYVVQGGLRMRLGMVTSMRSATFRLPAMFLGHSGDIRLVADPVGSSETYVSDIIQVRDGQQISLSVQNSLQLSNVAVWNGR